MRTFLSLLVLLLTACGDSTPNDSGPGDMGGSAACVDYCAAIAASCTDTLSQYASRSECMTACATFPPGSPTDTSGNTLACRTNHLAAAAGDPATHCMYAGPTGGGICE